MLRKAVFILAALVVAGAASAGNLIDNPSFENGLTDWTQDGVNANGSFESVPNGGSHTFDAGCVAPSGFPGSGSFWAVSCQGDPAIHVLYQDFTVPAEGGFLQMVAGVDMCSVAGGGVCSVTKRWGSGESGAASSGNFWAAKGFATCNPPVAPPPKGPVAPDDCAFIDITDPAADVLDEGAILQRLGGSVNSDATPSLSPVFDLAAYAGQTIRLRFWVQASIAPVAAQVDTVDGQGRHTIPALQPLGLALLALVLGGVGLLARRRRRN